MKKQLLSALASATALAALAGTPASAQSVNLKADLTPTSEVPPTNSQGRGSLTATFDPSSKRLTWRGTVTGLTGEATAAHFHGPAGPGQNAGVLVPAPGVKNGAPFEGSATLTDEQARLVTGGQTYFNIHTAANPQGEVRGQVTP